MRRVIALLGLMAFGVCSRPLDQPSAFEAVSIKPHDPEQPGGRMRNTPDAIAYTGVTIFDCMKVAYGVADYQIVAGRWEIVPKLRYDIAAKANGRIEGETRRRLLQRMLEERFGLVVHKEMRDVAVYELVVSGGKSKLAASQPESSASVRLRDDGVEFTHVTMQRVGDFLAGLESVNRPVVDKTGLEGRFDFLLRLSDTYDPAVTSSEHAIYTWPSIATDLRRVGLRLIPGRGQVQYVVVDKVRSPSEN